MYFVIHLLFPFDDVIPRLQKHSPLLESVRTPKVAPLIEESLVFFISTHNLKQASRDVTADPTCTSVPPSPSPINHSPAAAL